MESDIAVMKQEEVATIANKSPQMQTSNLQESSAVIMEVSDHQSEEVGIASDFLLNPVDFKENALFDQPRVLSWGRNDLGCLMYRNDEDIRDGIYSFSHTNRTIVSVASNVYHTAAVTSTGELYTCGQNDQGQVDADSPEEQFERPHVVDNIGNHKVISVACGLNHTVCVTAAGCAISYGSNESGQLGHSASKHTKVPPKVVNFTIAASRRAAMIITKVACGDLFSLFLLTSGEVFGCGSATFLGNPYRPNQLIVSQAERVETLVSSNIIDIAAGSAHALALSSSGELYGWGTNTHYQLGHETALPVVPALSQSDLKLEQTPVRIEVPKDIGSIVGISAGFSHSIFWTTKGWLFGAGANKYGQLGLFAPRVEKFEQINLPHFCIMATCGYNHTLALCFTSTTPTPLPADPLPSLHGNKLVRMYSLKTLETAEGSSVIYGFGYNQYGQVSPSTTMNIARSPQEVRELGQVWQINRTLYISAGGDQSFVIGIPEVTSKRQDSLAGGMLRKQFSSVASKATLPMDAAALLKLINKGLEDTSDPRMQSIVLTTVCEIFSSASLIAGSFRIDQQMGKGGAGVENYSINRTAPATTKDIRYDVEGVEACFVAYMSLGVHAVARLLAAMQQTVADLERAVAASPDLTLSDSSVKVFCIMWQSPIMANPSISSDLFIRLLKIASCQAVLMQDVVYNYFPAHIFASRLLKPVLEHLDNALGMAQAAESSTTLGPLILMCEVARWLWEINCRTHYVSPEMFNSKGLSSLPDALLVRDYLSWRAKMAPKQVELDNSANNGGKNKQDNGDVTPASPGCTSTTASAASPIGSGEGNSASVSRSAQNTSSAPPSGGSNDPKLVQKFFFFSCYPYLLSAEAKRRIVLGESRLYQQAAQNEAFTQGILMGGGVIFPWFIIPVERSHLLQQALMHIAHASPLDLKKPLKVVFIHEEGVDEGGVRKEFFQLLTNQLFDLAYGMFSVCDMGRSLWINRTNVWSNDEYNLVGSMLALALYNGVMLDIHLPQVLYKKLLQLPVGLEDLQSLDSQLYAGLKQLLEHEPAEEVEHVYCRNFVADYEEFGEKKTHELIPDGNNVAVTGANRQQFVEQIVQWLLVDSVQEQFAALYKGFTKVISPTQLYLLTPQELELLMVGTPYLDFKELQQHTEYVGESDWNATHPTITWFWEVLIDEFSLEEKQKFLLFVTGCIKAPIEGLRKLGLKIQRMGPDSEQLPTAHTCFNVLLLPAYSSKGKVRDRLSKAIHECEGFGLK
ncbi:hypothetical protein EON65_07765 [archaeon]|nr:MAG: hypothetical protein EON65_07765 [archaeon]